MSNFPEHIILFDGVCNLCNGAVRFVSKRDKKKLIHFASLQSEPGQNLLAKHGLSTTDLDTFVYIKHSHCFTRSEAGLQVLSDLGGIWKILSYAKVFPKTLLDFMYNMVAKNRYRIFGKTDSCVIDDMEISQNVIK
jgi:predicted DCC family thiol-disulfide oxidoreductase YuxK